MTEWPLAIHRCGRWGPTPHGPVALLDRRERAQEGARHGPHGPKCRLRITGEMRAPPCGKRALQGSLRPSPPRLGTQAAFLQRSVRYFRLDANGGADGHDVGAPGGGQRTTPWIASARCRPPQRQWLRREREQGRRVHARPRGQRRGLRTLPRGLTRNEMRAASAVLEAPPKCADRRRSPFSEGGGRGRLVASSSHRRRRASRARLSRQRTARSRARTRGWACL